MRFSEIVNEAAVITCLYHGTNIESLSGILVSGVVNASEPDDYDDAGWAGVSLTSSIDVAIKFAQEDRDWDGSWNSPVNDAVVLVFDAIGLKRDFELKKVTWDGSSQEKEYRTRGSIPNALRYLREIHVDPKSIEWWIETFEVCDEDAAADALRNIPSKLFKHKA